MRDRAERLYLFNLPYSVEHKQGFTESDNF